MARSYNKYRRRAGAPLYKIAARISDAAHEISQLNNKREEFIPKKSICKRIREWIF